MTYEYHQYLSAPVYKKSAAIEVYILSVSMKFNNATMNETMNLPLHLFPIWWTSNSPCTSDWSLWELSLQHY